MLDLRLIHHIVSQIYTISAIFRRDKLKNIDESTLSNLERSKYKILERNFNKLPEEFDEAFDFLETFCGEKKRYIDNNISSMLTNQFHDNILKDLENYRANGIHLIIVDAVTVLVVYKNIFAFPVTIVKIEESYYWRGIDSRKMSLITPFCYSKSFSYLIRKMIEYNCHLHLSF